MRGRRGERGQATVEWVGLVLLVGLAFAALVALGVRGPGLGLGAVLARHIACAAGIGDCGPVSELERAYGAGVAAAVVRNAPRLEYEEGMRAVPVDYRSCRRDACADGGYTGAVATSLAGEPVTAFIHVVDCRDPAEAARDGYDCDAEREGSLYLQYWLYYPGSATARAILGHAGWHPDDFESYQVRIGPDGRADARASSHHGYNGAGGNWLSDAGVVERPAWTQASGAYAISGGSHAGRVGAAGRRPWGAAPARWTDPAALRLVPLEPIAAAGSRLRFAITPPWDKRGWRDPEYAGTD